MNMFRQRGGFTLIELLVSVGIFVLITTMILARNSKFDDEVLLQSATYDVALTIRTAQNYGINVLGYQGGFDSPYGVYFESGSTVYELFRDDDGDRVPNPDGTETLDAYQLGRGFSIEKVCSLPGSDPVCTEGGLEEGVTVLFKRPDPEAIVYVVTGGVAEQNSTPGVVVELASPRGGQRFIAVQQTGQIGVLKADDVGGSELSNL